MIAILEFKADGMRFNLSWPIAPETLAGQA